MRLLVVEDDPMIGRAVVAGLQGGGYAVDWVRDGAEAELALASQVYDLALLDLGLPRRDGLEILKALRRRGNRLPVRPDAQHGVASAGVVLGDDRDPHARRCTASVSCSRALGTYGRSARKRRASSIASSPE